MQRHRSGDSLNIVVDGIFTTMIRVNLSNGTKKATRLSTFSSCMCFGEIGFLTGQPRSADVIALLRGRGRRGQPAAASETMLWEGCCRKMDP